MRKEWFQHVKECRDKETKKRKRLDKKNFKECTHKEGMAIASTTWAKKKAQILRKRNKIKKPVEEKGDQ